MTIPRYQESPGFNPPGMVDVGGGDRALAQGLQIGVRDAGGVADLAYKRAAVQAELTGKVAGAKDAIQYDANGQLLPLSTLPDAATIYGKAYREAAITNYALALSADAEVKASELATQHGNDPNGFRVAWNSYQTGTLKEALPEVAAVITPHLVRIGGQQYASLFDQQHQAAIDQARIGAKSQLERLTGALAGRLKGMPYDGSSMMVANDLIRTEAGPVIASLAAIDPSFGPESQKAAVQGLTQSVIGTLVANTAEEIGRKVIRDPSSGMLTHDTAGVDRYLAQAWDGSPELQRLFTPDAWKGVVSDARTRVALSAAGDQLRLDAANQATMAGIYTNRQEVQDQIDAAKIEFAQTGSPDKLLALDETIKHAGNLGMSTAENAQAVASYRRDIHSDILAKVADPQWQITQAYVGAMMSGQGVELPEGPIGDAAATRIRMFLRSSDGQPLDPAKADQTAWASYFSLGKRLSPFDTAIFDTAGPTTPPDKLMALASNYHAMALADPRIAKQLKNAGLLQDYYDNVIGNHQSPEDWAKTYGARTGQGPVDPQSRMSIDYAHKIVDQATKDGTLDKGVVDRINGSINDAHPEHGWLRGISSSFGITGTPAGLRLVPNGSPAFTNLGGVFQLQFPATWGEAFGTEGPDGRVIINQSYTDAFKQVAEGKALHGAPNITVAMDLAHAEMDAVNYAGISQLLAPDPYQRPAFTRGSVVVGEFSPERYYNADGRSLMAALGRDLNEMPQVLEAAGSPTHVRDWAVEARAGNVRLSPVPLGTDKDGHQVVQYRVQWLDGTSWHDLTFGDKGLWHYDPAPSRAQLTQDRADLEAAVTQREAVLKRFNIDPNGSFGRAYVQYGAQVDKYFTQTDRAVRKVLPDPDARIQLMLNWLKRQLDVPADLNHLDTTGFDTPSAADKPNPSKP
jgi:hypothetical protein